MSLLPPGGRSRAHCLLGWMGCQEIGGSRELKRVLAGNSSDKALQENRSFKPPVAKQFGIKRNHHDRFEVVTEESLDLALPRFEKMVRVSVGQPLRRRRIVQRLFTFPGRDSIVFHAGKLANAPTDRA